LAPGPSNPTFLYSQLSPLTIHVVLGGDGLCKQTKKFFFKLVVHPFEWRPYLFFPHAQGPAVWGVPVYPLAWDPPPASFSAGLKQARPWAAWIQALLDLKPPLAIFEIEYAVVLSLGVLTKLPLFTLFMGFIQRFLPGGPFFLYFLFRFISLGPKCSSALHASPLPTYNPPPPPLPPI